MGLRMPRPLKITCRKMVSNCHNLAYFCCAKFDRSKLRLFFIFPSPVLAALTYCANLGTCT